MMRHNELFNKTPRLDNIKLDYFDPSSEWVVDYWAPTFENEDHSWLDLHPLPYVLCSDPGESGVSQNLTPTKHDEDEDEDD